VTGELADELRELADWSLVDEGTDQHVEEGVQVRVGQQSLRPEELHELDVGVDRLGVIEEHEEELDCVLLDG
jgi:hypothetical protein